MQTHLHVPLLCRQCRPRCFLVFFFVLLLSFFGKKQNKTGDMGSKDAFTLCSACTGKSTVCDAETCAAANQSAGLISEIMNTNHIVLDFLSSCFLSDLLSVLPRTRTRTYAHAHTQPSILCVVDLAARMRARMQHVLRRSPWQRRLMLLGRLYRLQEKHAQLHQAGETF